MFTMTKIFFLTIIAITRWRYEFGDAEIVSIHSKTTSAILFYIIVHQPEYENSYSRYWPDYILIFYVLDLHALLFGFDHHAMIVDFDQIFFG